MSKKLVTNVMPIKKKKKKAMWTTSCTEVVKRFFFIGLEQEKEEKEGNTDEQLKENKKRKNHATYNYKNKFMHSIIFVPDTRAACYQGYKTLLWVAHDQDKVQQGFGKLSWHCIMGGVYYITMRRNSEGKLNTGSCSLTKKKRKKVQMFCNTIRTRSNYPKKKRKELHVNEDEYGICSLFGK